MTATPRALAALLNDRRAYLDPGAVGALALAWLKAATAQGFDPDQGLPSTVRAAVLAQGSAGGSDGYGHEGSAAELQPPATGRSKRKGSETVEQAMRRGGTLCSLELNRCC